MESTHWFLAVVEGYADTYIRVEGNGAAEDNKAKMLDSVIHNIAATSTTRMGINTALMA